MRPLSRTAAARSLAYGIGIVTTLAWSSLIFAQTSSPTQSQPPRAPGAEQIITLPQALEHALADSIWLRAASHEVSAATAAIEQGGARPNPQLSYEMEDTRKATRTNTVMLSQAVELGGKRAARIVAAERGQDVAQAQLRARRAEIRAQVRSAFRDVLAAQENQRLSDEALTLAQRATLAASRRVQAGSVSPLEESRARLEEANVRVAQAQAVVSLGAARNRLSALWGESPAHFARVEGQLNDLPVVPEIEALLARIEDAPTLHIAAHELARREALARVEQSRRYPDVNLSVGVKRATELGRNQTLLGVSIPLPLFDSNRGNVREALARSEQARDERAAARTRLSAELIQARANLYANRLEAESLSRDVLPGAQTALDAAARGYELGKFGFIDVMDAQRNLFQVRTQRLRALINAHKAATDIQQLLGDDEGTETRASATNTTAP